MYNSGVSEKITPYDFGRRQDVVTDEGDVVAIDPEGEVLTDFDWMAESYEAGVSVSLVERRMALEALAAVYAEYARAKGLGKAVDSPKHRPDLRRRYFDADAVADGALSKAKGALRREAELMEPLLKSDALVGAGFDDRDVEDTIQLTSIGIRHAIGVDVGSKNRTRVMRSLYVPEGESK